MGREQCLPVSDNLFPVALKYTNPPFYIQSGDDFSELDVA